MQSLSTSWELRPALPMARDPAPLAGFLRVSSGSKNSRVAKSCLCSIRACFLLTSQALLHGVLLWFALRLMSNKAIGCIIWAVMAGECSSVWLVGEAFAMVWLCPPGRANLMATSTCFIFSTSILLCCHGNRRENLRYYSHFETFRGYYKRQTPFPGVVKKHTCSKYPMPAGNARPSRYVFAYAAAATVPLVLSSSSWSRLIIRLVHILVPRN